MADDERVTVQTYVPRYQKERWADHADELDMTSLSEFVRTMVQAGRRDFDVPGRRESERSGSSDVADSVVSTLESEGVLDWDELVAALVDDVETELDAALERLQNENRIRYSGRDGGYVLTTDE